MMAKLFILKDDREMREAQKASPKARMMKEFHCNFLGIFLTIGK